MNQTIDDILTNCKKSFCAKMDDKNKPHKTAANYGGNKGDTFVRTKEGEYTGFSVKLLEDLKPLLTNRRIIKALNKLSTNNIQDCIKILNLNDEVIKYGISIIYSVIKEWLMINNINVPLEIENNITVKLNEQLVTWIKTVRSDPINCKIQIMDIGKSKKGNSVVPIDWINRIFNCGLELHNEMNKLEWRQNKPPVNYCCIHSMVKKDVFTWAKKSDVLDYNPNYGIYVKIGSEIINFTTTNYNEWLDQLDNRLDILKCVDKNQDKFIIVCNLSDYTTDNQYVDCENVGLLVSRLQKSIRRGRGCASFLFDTITKLSKAKPYNLAEHQFIKVSGSRQLCWRLFITIMEDVEPYLCSNNNEYLSLQDLVCFSILTQNDPNIQFNNNFINKLIHLALLVQHNDEVTHNWNWRKSKPSNENKFDNNNDYIKLALKCMPMMSGDTVLLQKSLNFIKFYKLKPLDYTNNIDMLMKYSNKEQINKCMLASNDMHCNPNILLNLQSCLPFIPHLDEHTTWGLSSFIWENSSKINIRNETVPKLSNNGILILNTLNVIQENKIINGITNYTDELQNTEIIELPSNISTLESRIGFLLLFGEKTKLPVINKMKTIDVIVGGNNTKPCKVKRGDIYLDGEERFLGEIRYVDHIKNGIIIKLPNPPEGCMWSINKKNVTISAKIIESNKNEFINKVKFYVDNIELNLFDSSPILKKNGGVNYLKIGNKLKELVEIALYSKQQTKLLSGYSVNTILRGLWKYRIDNNLFCVYEWIIYNGIPNNIWKCIYSKIYNNIDNNIIIGPVDRMGNKLSESINYMYEGTLLRIFNLLAFLFPNVIEIKSKLKFHINKNVQQYINFLNDIKILAFNKNETIKDNMIVPKINTQLWNHQQKSLDHIFNEMVTLGRKGFGDASNVGSGKTLSALSVMAKLLNHNYENNSKNYFGFLVLLPTINLYDTWVTEINKHTINFDVVTQHSNGNLNKPIKYNSILITTLGRMRDHPIINPWILVIIDECLSVQNKEAFQTEEAFKQILCAQYGVIMMSATFFRSRFDKLFYMLKMLRSGLLEEKKYLDTILNECIICNIGDTFRKWTSITNRFDMDADLKNKYNNILQLNLSSEQIYNKLSKLLYDKFDYINAFKQIICKLDNNKRSLIYAKSKKEADLIATINNVSRYPDKSKKHVVISYTEGTYGLNDLITYNVIITRPPNPDLLPQMKGRLDRFGQKNNNLYIEYLIVKDTIEEAGILKLEMCSNFYKDYILPLAVFYDLATNRNILLRNEVMINRCNREIDQLWEKMDDKLMEIKKMMNDFNQHIAI